MSLSKLLPTLDNAGRRLILAEVLGEPVGIKLARSRLQKEKEHREKKQILNRETDRSTSSLSGEE